MPGLRARSFIGRFARLLREVRTKGGEMFAVGERLECVSAMRGRRRGHSRFGFQDPKTPSRYVSGVEADNILWVD